MRSPLSNAPSLIVVRSHCIGLNVDPFFKQGWNSPENAELRKANDIPKVASVFSQRARPSPTEMIRFLNEYRDRFGVELM